MRYSGRRYANFARHILLGHYAFVSLFAAAIWWLSIWATLYIMIWGLIIAAGAFILLAAEEFIARFRRIGRCDFDLFSLFLTGRHGWRWHLALIYYGFAEALFLRRQPLLLVLFSSLWFLSNTRLLLIHCRRIADSDYASHFASVIWLPPSIYSFLLPRLRMADL